ncbi:hypothetical protein G6F37_011390 [Rhizopus arrhizus]|nr:hypothetical protein G6F38_011155 [Rhizopus arrhizus]KAG1149580.1 hypothetical protein G6F37_011390 [Rhizopus arrhizus]
MSFDIPGYFLDLKTKKYYKITQTGPYSMSELRKRLAAEEEQAKTIKAEIKRPKPRPATIADFCRQRATGTNHQLTFNSNAGIFMNSLKHRSTIVTSEDFQDAQVVMTGGSEYGGMLVASKDQLCYNFGYQLNPSFQMWRYGYCNIQNGGSTVTSIQYTPENQKRDCSTVSLSTSNGIFERITVPKDLVLSADEAKQLLTDDVPTRDGSQLKQFPAQSRSMGRVEAMFSEHREMIWSLDTDYAKDCAVLGGEKRVYHLTGDLRRIASSRINSAAFDVHLSKWQPNHCLAGLRNGTIQLFDLRRKPLSFNTICEASSSVTKIVEMDSQLLLSVSLDGSISIWDKRKFRKEPVRRLSGHVNEATHGLAFDVDLDNELLLVSGNDGCVRIWSLSNTASSQPIWTSEKFTRHVTSAKLFIDKQFPAIQPNWLPYSTLKRHNPGVLIFANENSSNVAKYYSIF